MITLLEALEPKRLLELQRHFLLVFAISPTTCKILLGMRMQLMPKPIQVSVRFYDTGSNKAEPRILKNVLLLHMGEKCIN